MANVKITDLGAYTDPASTDVLPIVDVGADVTKKVSVGEVVGKISGDVDVATDGTSSITAGVIVDADVNATAAIAGTKIDPDFGSQNIETSGDINLDDGGTYSTTLQIVTPTADRTISFPDATGTVALVAGSNGQLTYNSSGAQAGLTSASIGSTDEINISLAGAASTPPVSFTGSWFTGGTSTTTKPQLLIEPTGTTSTAWSTSGTGLGVNAASGFSGLLADLQLNGTSEWAFGTTALTVGDANDIAFGTTTGTKLGTATSQKIGFYNATPVVQPTTGVAEAAFVENSGGTAVNVDSTFGGYTIQQVVEALQTLGLLA